jgi:hypothetical protein
MALTDGLISYWRLDESSGSRADSHGGNALAENGGVGSAAGKIGSAADFDGANDYLSRADNADLSTGNIDFTLQAWVQLGSKSAGRAIVSKLNSSGTSSEYTLLYDSADDRFEFRITGNGVAWQGTVTANAFGSPSAGTWYLLHAWHDSVNDEIGIAVNAGTPDTASYASGGTDTASPFNVGSYGGGAGDFFDGLIDEVAFWKRVLSGAERAELYNSGSGLAYPFTAGAGPARPRRPRAVLEPAFEYSW